MFQKVLLFFFFWPVAYPQNMKKIKDYVVEVKLYQILLHTHSCFSISANESLVSLLVICSGLINKIYMLTHLEIQ